MAEYTDDIFIVFRGSDEKQDWIRNFTYDMIPYKSLGMCHKGFYLSFYDIWLLIVDKLITMPKKNLIPIGHSLGGVLANLATIELIIADYLGNPKATYTFGQPKGCNKQLRDFVDRNFKEYYRMVNNNDIAPRVPSQIQGFYHCGKRLYATRNKIIKTDISKWELIKDRFYGFIEAITEPGLEYLKDHPIQTYIEAIETTMYNFKVNEKDTF